MTKLDKYILSEFSGPFAFGLGVFFSLLIGVDMLYDALRYAIRENMPAGVVVAVLGYRLPTMAALTVPMAMIFAGLMSFARLSSEGELTAMRVAGASVLRIVAPVLVVAAVVSAGMTFVAHTYIPEANGMSARILAEYRRRGPALSHLMIRVPQRGRLERIVYIDRLDAARGLMHWVIIIEFRERRWVTLVAKRAVWGGGRWRLEEVEHTDVTPDGTRTERIAELEYDIGRAPADLQRIRYDVTELPTRELLRELAVVSAGPARDRSRAISIRTEIANRWATPWSVLGFALVGVALGVRPQRTSRGVALGVSLAVILLYYIVMHTMTVVSEQGGLPPAVCAWAADVVLYVMGTVGLLSRAG